MPLAHRPLRTAYRSEHFPYGDKEKKKKFTRAGVFTKCALTTYAVVNCEELVRLAIKIAHSFIFLKKANYIVCLRLSNSVLYDIGSYISQGSNLKLG